MDHTPIVKHLIHKRWDAFRRKDFVRYQELKNLVRVKIAQAKSICNWANNLSKPNDLWKKVNHIQGNNKSNAFDKLINSHDSIVDLVNGINDKFCTNFTNACKKPLSDILADCDNFSFNSWELVVSECTVFDLLSKLNTKGRITETILTQF